MVASRAQTSGKKQKHMTQHIYKHRLYTYVYMLSFIHMHIKCMYIYMQHTYINNYVHAYIHPYTYAYTYVCVFTYAYRKLNVHCRIFSIGNRTPIG